MVTVSLDEQRKANVNTQELAERLVVLAEMQNEQSREFRMLAASLVEDDAHCKCGLKLSETWEYCPGCGAKNAHHSAAAPVSAGKAPVIAIPDAETKAAHETAKIVAAESAARIESVKPDTLTVSSELPENVALSVDEHGNVVIVSRLGVFVQQTPTGEKVVSTTGKVRSASGWSLRRINFAYASRKYSAVVEIRDVTDAKYPDRKDK